MAGTGCCLGNQTDSFQFAYQILNGDGTIIARVTSTSNFAGSAKAGVMIRETLAADSGNAFMGLQNGYSPLFQYRVAPGAGTGASGGPSATVPDWIKLVRTGNSFSGYASSDGSNWTQIGSTVTAVMAGPVYVGLAVTSESGSVVTATFDNVVVSSGANTMPDFVLGTIPTLSVAIAGGGSTGYPKVSVNAVNNFNRTVNLTVTGLPTGASGSFSPTSLTGSGTSLLTITTSPGTPAGSYPLTITGTSGSLTHTAPLTLTVTSIASTLPATWTNQDVGPGGGGTGATYSNWTFSVAGTGCCLGSQIDSFQFAYQTLNGDGAIIARVTSTSNFAGSAKAGVMIRETLARESTNAFMGLQNGYSPLFQYRGTTTAGTGASGGPSVTVPYWIKLVRVGNSFTGYAAADGSNWTQIGSTVTAVMAGAVYVGLAVTSESGSAATASFDNLVILSSANTTPDFTLGTVPSSMTIGAGGVVYPKVSVNPLNGFNGIVNLSTTGLPTGATANFSPTVLGASAVSLLTITTTASTPAGSYLLTITGVSGSVQTTAGPVQMATLRTSDHSLRGPLVFALFPLLS